ncbi:MAG: tRNA (adenosine(37)-N6)-dimethylallyltransferase MiaA [Victivallales bacterium]|nr:tRNA (adenosine(37)-N6)-dimethylallyltransferase MiaA [Victivallales bacterium]
MQERKLEVEHDVCILGPTCCWKSETAIAIAARIGAEIVSCDSMQVYRGLEIGTAQPSKAEQEGVPHHLIGCLDMEERYDVNKFLDSAKTVIDGIHARGRRAVIVGGTGMYARALVYGHSLLPSDAEVFESVRAQLENGGRDALEYELAAAAGGRDNVPKDLLLNPRRLIRACEVLRITGRLAWQLQNDGRIPNPSFRQFILLPELELLKGRIRQRTARMIEAGWIDEAQRAIGRGLMQTPTARQALGYSEIASFLDGDGPDTVEELTALLVSKTVKYARRQFTWFRHQHPGAELLAVSSGSEASKAILEEL